MRGKLVLLVATMLAACGQQGEDATTGFQVVQTVKVGRAPHGMRVEGNFVYIANAGDDTIGVVDLTQGEQVRTIPAPGTPLDVIRHGDDWLVTAFRGSVLRRINDAGEVLETYEVGESPSLYTGGPEGAIVSVVSENADQISFFDRDNGTVVKQLTTGDAPYPGHMSKDGVLLFVPNRSDGTVSVFDLLNDKLAATVPVCKQPEGGTLTKDEVSYIVACGGDNKVVFINTASFEVTGEISDGIGARPFSVVAGPEGRFAYVNNAGGETVSVIDLSQHKVVEAIPTGKQPIVMRIFDRKLYVTNEVSDDLTVIQLPPAPKVVGDAKNEVVVLGMIHGGHRTSERYSIDVLKAAFRNIKPDYVLTEMPPNRFDRAMADWREFGEIREARISRFPEYTDALFPLMEELGFTIIPTAAWNAPMNDYRRAALERLSQDPARTKEWQDYEAAEKAMDEALAARGDDPHFIHSDEYDATIKTGLRPYDVHFNDDLGTGGWTTINQAHYALIADALDAHKGEGKRILITYGAGHKYWFLEQLRNRDDIILVDPKGFF